MSYRRFVVVCTDLSDKEPHTQVGVGCVVTSGSLGGVIASTVLENTRDVGSIPNLGRIFPICMTALPVLFQIATKSVAIIS